MARHTLVVPFLTDDPAFARGVEVGMLYARMKAGGEVDDLFLTDNQEQILLMANRLGWDVLDFGPCEVEGWFRLHMRRRDATPGLPALAD